MRVLIAQSRFLLGGSETYAVTAAEQLEQLGHPTTIFAGEASPKGRELAASRGLTLITGDLASLAERDDVDAVIAQDGAGAYALASRQDLAQVFVVHGFAAYEHPPQALRPAPPVVVLNDRVHRHVAALASQPEIVRLRQPIDLQRFKPRGPSRPQARRVLVFSNYLQPDRLAILGAACEDLGLELVSMGHTSETSVSPQERIAEADVVVGYGRSVLEAMVMGRAAYVWDHAGGDGWVTPETYPALEADGFSGAATDAVIDGDRLREDLAAYRPEMGVLAYDLVRARHSAAHHAEELVRLLERAEPPAVDPAHEGLGLLIRREVRQREATEQAEQQLRLQAGDLEAARARAAELAPALEQACSALEHSEDLLASERERRVELEGQLGAALGSTSWRLTAPLRRLTELLRAVRDRFAGS
jgi:hypothetical protein